MLVFIGGVGIYLWGVKFAPQTKVDCSKPSNVYIIEEWSECSISGVRTRSVTKKKDEDITCEAPELVDKPKEVETCQYIPVCTEKHYSIGKWSTCIDGTRTREVENIVNCEISEEDKELGTFLKQKECPDTKSTLLLRGFTTDVDSELPNPYSPSYRNVSIKPRGQFESLKLIVSAKTSVLGGKDYIVPDEYYFFMFGIDEISRALATTRIGDARLDVSDYGIIRGEEFPTIKRFDLKNIHLANPNDQGVGSTEREYTNYLNENTEKEMQITLFLADGRSMTATDPMDRIFGTITEAHFEYECEKGSQCSIQRIPSLTTNNDN